MASILRFFRRPLSPAAVKVLLQMLSIAIAVCLWLIVTGGVVKTK